MGTIFTPKAFSSDSNTNRSGHYGGSFSIDAGMSVYCTIPLSSIDYSGHATAQLLITTGSVSIQLEANNSDEENFMIPVDATTKVSHPALLTNQSASIILESVLIPAFRHVRYKITAGGVAAEGSFLLELITGRL